MAKNGHCNIISEKNTILCHKMLKVDDTGFTCNTLINPMFLGKEMNADYHKDRIK